MACEMKNISSRENFSSPYRTTCAVKKLQDMLVMLLKRYKKWWLQPAFQHSAEIKSFAAITWLCRAVLLLLRRAVVHPIYLV